MKLKYQLRGIGIGLLVTTIILTLAHGMRDVARSESKPKESASAGSIIAFDKNEIKESQGVTEPDTSAVKPSKEAGSESATKESATKESATKEPATKEPATKQPETKEPATKEPATQKPTEAPTKAPVANGEVVTVHIVNVYKASIAADILYNAGVITDKAAFNKYMYESGYDLKIQEGYYQVKKGDSFVNIAKTITRSR